MPSHFNLCFNKQEFSSRDHNTHSPFPSPFVDLKLSVLNSSYFPTWRFNFVTLECTFVLYQICIQHSFFFSASKNQQLAFNISMSEFHRSTNLHTFNSHKSPTALRFFLRILPELRFIHAYGKSSPLSSPRSRCSCNSIFSVCTSTDKLE